MGLAVEELKVRANGRAGGARHIIWIGTNRGHEPPPARGGQSR
jgi:hypothetical protein